MASDTQRNLLPLLFVRLLGLLRLVGRITAYDAPASVLRGYTAQEMSIWRETINHFDSIKIGLTATPAAHTTALFGPPVFRYTVEQAILDGYLVARIEPVKEGADIEGMVGRAWRTSLLAGADHVTREALAGVVATFMPSTQGLERELQETAAMLECTDSQFLPPSILEKMAAEGGRGKLQARLTALKQIVKEL